MGAYVNPKNRAAQNIAQNRADKTHLTQAMYFMALKMEEGRRMENGNGREKKSSSIFSIHTYKAYNKYSIRKYDIRSCSCSIQLALILTTKESISSSKSSIIYCIESSTFIESLASYFFSLPTNKTTVQRVIL